MVRQPFLFLYATTKCNIYILQIQQMTDYRVI